MTALNCVRVEREEIVERYVAAISLDEATAAEFEEHYFACPKCFERLQAARAASAALSGRPGMRAWGIRNWWIAGLAAAAAILLAVLWPMHPRPRVDAVEVAKVETPDYHELARYAAP